VNPIAFRLGYRLAPGVIGSYLALVEKTSRVQVINEAVIERVTRSHGSAIYAVWHSRLLFTAYHFRHRDVRVIISRSRDGDVIARVVERWGYHPVRGSSSRGGALAFRQLARLLRAGNNVVVTPDGPRGPREEVQPGVAALARITGRPVVPVSYDAARKIVLNSWDRFIIPLPFSSIRIVLGEPVEPAGEEDDLRNRVARGLAEAAAAALLSTP